MRTESYQTLDPGQDTPPVSHTRQDTTSILVIAGLTLAYLGLKIQDLLEQHKVAQHERVRAQKAAHRKAYFDQVNRERHTGELTD